MKISGSAEDGQDHSLYGIMNLFLMPYFKIIATPDLN